MCFIKITELKLHYVQNFECEYRGKIVVKNRGAMEMYFINNNK